MVATSLPHAIRWAVCTPRTHDRNPAMSDISNLALPGDPSISAARFGSHIPSVI